MVHSAGGLGVSVSRAVVGVVPMVWPPLAGCVRRFSVS